MKLTVAKEETLDLLEIRVGLVMEVEVEESAHMPSYRLTVDFGKFGTKTSVGRFTHHNPEQIKGKLVLGVLNFSPLKIGETVSEVLILGVQVPKEASGEATFITPAIDVHVGSKLF